MRGRGARWVWIPVVAAGIGAGPGPARSAPAPAGPARKEAADRAMGYLVPRVFRLADSAGTPRKPFTLAITGLDLLMARGRTVGPGGTSDVARVKGELLDYLAEVERRSRDAESLPSAHGVADSERLVQYTWVLGAAALFFAEAGARGLFRTEARSALERIGTLLGEAQDANGGWGHGRIRPGGSPPTGRLPSAPGLLAGGYPSTLVSSTNVVALGLGLARPWVALERQRTHPWDAMLGRVRKHLLDAQLPSGNFPYDLSQRSAGADATGVGRTAGALGALLALGVPANDDAARRAAGFLDDRLETVPEGHGSPALNVFLAAVTARLRGEAAVRAFDRTLLPRILAKQDEDGALDCICKGEGFGVTCDSATGGLHPSGIPAFEEAQKTYVTALHLFALLLDAPERLEILAPRKGAVPLPPAAPVTPR